MDSVINFANSIILFHSPATLQMRKLSQHKLAQGNTVCKQVLFVLIYLLTDTGKFYIQPTSLCSWKLLLSLSLALTQVGCRKWGTESPERLPHCAQGRATFLQVLRKGLLFSETNAEVTEPQTGDKKPDFNLITFLLVLLPKTFLSLPSPFLLPNSPFSSSPTFISFTSTGILDIFKARIKFPSSERPSPTTWLGNLLNENEDCCRGKGRADF